jgi:transcriptional regulator with XRE-family HTH domain
MRQLKPIPSELMTSKTLARRVFELREFRNMTVRDLAKASRFSVQRVEDIESGLETWLSSSDRQLLAKALNVEPQLLQEVETRSGLQPTTEDVRTNEQLVEAILQGVRDLQCPNCGGTLKCSVQEALDIEGNPTQFAKAFCVNCPFVLK